MNRTPSLDSVYPCRRDAEGRHLCRYCGGVLSGRRTAWCGEECVREALIRIRPGWARSAVYNRDRGVCALCGFDAGLVERAARHLAGSLDGYFDVAPYLAIREARCLLARVGGATMGLWDGRFPHLWEADHILPVAEGGNLCGLDGYRTLCRRCHAKESGRLRKRLNQRRKDATEAEAVKP
jgi:5-methylcytosine-specific restriction enzyme A